MAELVAQQASPLQKVERNDFKYNRSNETSTPSDSQLISNQEQSSLIYTSLVQKNNCFESTKAEKITPQKNAALKRFRKAAFGIQFTQTLGRDLHSVLNKEFVDLKDPNDCQIAVDLLQKTTKKTMREILFLKRAVEGLRFFQNRKDNLNPKLYAILFDEFKVKLCKKQEVIYHYGDAASNFYIVLTGSCYLLTPNDEQKMLNQSFEFSSLKAMYDSSRNGISYESINRYSKFGLANNQIYNPSSSPQQITAGNKEGTENPYYWDSFNNFLNFCFNGFQVTCEYRAGDSFGDLALTTRSKQAGTVVVGEDSILLSLTKEGYEHILGEEQKQIIKNKMNFFLQFRFFKNFTDSGLISMLSSLRDISLKKGDIIYKEGDNVDFVYFIVDGEVELSQKCPILQDSQINKVKSWNNSNNENNRSFQKDSPNLIDKRQTPRNNNHVAKLDRRLRNLNSVEEEKHRQRCQLSVKFALLGNNSCFGEYEIVQENRQRFQQAECYSLGLQLYVIKKEILVNYLKAFESQQLLKEYAFAAQKERHSRIDKARRISQRMMQSQLKEAQRINQSKSHSLENSINQTLTPSVSVDILDVSAVLHPIDLQHDVVTINMIKDNTATTDNNNHIFNQNYSQITESNGFKSLKYSLSKINNKTAEKTALTILNNSNTTGSTVDKYSIVCQGLHNRNYNSSYQVNSYLDSTISDSITTPTKDNRNFQITEFTRQKLVRNIKLIERKKRKIFSELKSVQSYSFSPLESVNASDLDIGDGSNKKLIKNQDHHREILFDYLFQETPLLSKIKGSKGRQKVNKHYVSLQTGSFDYVSKENANLMEVIHKSMRQGDKAQNEELKDVDDYHNLPGLANKRLEFRRNIGSMSYINLSSPSTNSNEKLHSNSVNDINKKSEFYKRNSFLHRNSLISAKHLKRNSLSMSSLDQLTNHTNLQQQSSNNTTNIHTQGLKVQKGNHKYHNSFEISMKHINFSINRNSSNTNNNEIGYPNHNSVSSIKQLPPLNSIPRQNYFQNITDTNKNSFSINKNRYFSLPDLSINSIPQNPLQNTHNPMHLVNDRNSFDSSHISHQYSAFQSIFSQKRTFSLHNISKNPIDKINENLASISKNTPNQFNKNNHLTSNCAQKIFTRILNNSSSSPII